MVVFMPLEHIDQESNMCRPGTVGHFEIFKMAIKMVAILEK